jgi:hypothetical protein
MREVVMDTSQFKIKHCSHEELAVGAGSFFAFLISFITMVATNKML